MTSSATDKMLEIYTFFENRTEIYTFYENRIEIYIFYENRTEIYLCTVFENRLEIFEHFVNGRWRQMKSLLVSKYRVFRLKAWLNRVGLVLVIAEDPKSVSKSWLLETLPSMAFSGNEIFLSLGKHYTKDCVFISICDISLEENLSYRPYIFSCKAMSLQYC